MSTHIKFFLSSTNTVSGCTHVHSVCKVHKVHMPTIPNLTSTPAHLYQKIMTHMLCQIKVP